MKSYDFLILGGGMVGAATALGIAKLGYRVALIEKNPPKTFTHKEKLDLRISAISPASVRLLDNLGVWSSIQNMRVWSYQRMAVWEDLDARVTFDAESLAMDELGFMIENQVIQSALWHACKQRQEIDFYENVRVEHIFSDAQGHVIEIDTGEMFRGDWLVGADGANSQARAHARIGVTAWDYRHQCMLIHVETTTAEQDITWQWFTPAGPRSFLPLGDGQASLVWYDSPARIQQLSQLSNQELACEIARHYPECLGQVKVLNHGFFPLTRRHAHDYVKNRTILVGDAAHTINPLAGQGVNLGFKDVVVLLNSIELHGLSDHGKALKRYERKRKPDNLVMQSVMDSFYLGFSNDFSAFKALRNLGLKIANRQTLLKQAVMKYAMGL